MRDRNPNRRCLQVELLEQRQMLSGILRTPPVATLPREVAPPLQLSGIPSTPSSAALPYQIALTPRREVAPPPPVTAVTSSPAVQAWTTARYDAFGRSVGFTVHYKVYDSQRGAWAENASDVAGTLLGLINQNGVVSWSSVQYDSFGRLNGNTVAYTTYDTARGAWSTQSSPVAGRLLNLINRDSVVAWSSVQYDLLGRFNGNTVAYTTYDTARGAWSTQSSPVAGSLLLLDERSGTVTWTSSQDQFRTVTESRLYDRQRGGWNGGTQIRR
jgi:hypothetical protein